MAVPQDQTVAEEPTEPDSSAAAALVVPTGPSDPSAPPAAGTTAAPIVDPTSVFAAALKAGLVDQSFARHQAQAAAAADAPRDASSSPATYHLDSPSVLTTALPSTVKVLRDPKLLATAVGSGMVWTLGLVVVAAVLGNGIKRRYDRWSAALSRLPVPSPIGLMGRLLSAAHWAAIVAVVALNAVVLSLISPGTGHGLLGVRVLISVGAGLVGSALPYLLVAWLARARWGEDIVLHGLPFGVVVAALGVAVSRAIGFVPGLLAGSTIQLVHRGTARRRAIVQAASAGLTLGVGVVCWIGASAVASETGWAMLLVHDALASGAVIAILRTLIEMLPLSFCAGSLLYDEMRRTWACLCVVTGLLFTAVVLPRPDYWVNVGGRVTWWLTVAGVAIVVALVLVALLHRGDRRSEDRAGFAARASDG